jgi:hypothetical protein
MNTKFKVGDKVSNLYGKTLTVRDVTGSQVFVHEESNGWYHPTKLYLVG